MRAIKIDLITGFLGSGKTTFIRKYAEHLVNGGIKVGIIENDFGAINVDMLMLQDVLGDLCDVEQIVGGTVVEDWKRRFRTKLISMAMRGFGRILVEPSGIYDVDAFFDVLYDDTVGNWYEIGSIFTIVDGAVDGQLSKPEEYLMVSQLANSGKILYSKVENCSAQELEERTEQLNEMLSHFKCNRKLCFETDVIAKPWGEYTEEDFVTLMSCGWKRADHEKMWFDTKEAFSSHFVMNLHMEKEPFCQVCRQIFEDEGCGKVARVKGFLPLEAGEEQEGQWIQLNLTKDHQEIRSVKEGQEIIIFIGQDLHTEKIDEYLQ